MRRLTRIVPALGPVVAALAVLAVLADGGSARADLFKCSKGADVWVTNYKAPGARCTRLDIETDPPERRGDKAWRPASTGGSGNGGSARADTPTRTASNDGPGAFERPAAKRERFAPIEPAAARPSGDEPDQREGREALYAPYFDEAAELYDLPEPFLRAVARVESNFRYKAKSSAGAMGLMQLMPGTARDMGVSDAWDPRSNILGGARLLRVLADRFGGDMVKVLAAYHAGGGAVADADGIPYEATESYVRTVLDYYYQYKQLAGHDSP